MSEETYPPTFIHHLSHLKKSKNEADKVLETLSPGHNAAEASIAICWELVFDHFCNDQAQTYSISDLNTLSAVIHKLITSNTQIKTLEHKIQDQHHKLEERDRVKEELRKQLEQNSGERGLSAETLALIEEQLRLL